MKRIALAVCAASTALLGACVAPVQAPAPATAARPLPQPPTPHAIGQIDWHDMPATPGVWQWRREGRLTVARFGNPALFSMTCDPVTGMIGLTRGGLTGTSTVMSVSTTSLTRSLAIPAGGTVALPARDPLLDAMAYSRGRFAVKVPGVMSLYLPSWPEVGRVIEDCR